MDRLMEAVKTHFGTVDSHLRPDAYVGFSGPGTSLIPGPPIQGPNDQVLTPDQYINPSEHGQTHTQHE